MFCSIDPNKPKAISGEDINVAALMIAIMVSAQTSKAVFIYFLCSTLVACDTKTTLNDCNLQL